MPTVGGLDVEIIVSTDVEDDVYSVEFYLPAESGVFLCAVTRGFGEEEVYFLARQDGRRLPASFVAEALQIANVELEEFPVEE